MNPASNEHRSMQLLGTSGLSRTFLFILIGISLGATQPVFGGTFNTARTLKPAAFSLGLEGEVFALNPTAAAIDLHGGVGIFQKFDLELQYRLPLSPRIAPLFGGNIEAQLVREQALAPSLSLSLGTHVEGWQDLYLDGTLMVSKAFRAVEPYLALSTSIGLPVAYAPRTLKGTGGLCIHLARVSELLLEINIGFRGTPASVSGGLNFYF